MRTEEIIVNIIFDAGKGSTPVQSREGVSGSPYGELPRPSRPGYRFDGWYLGDQPVTAGSILEATEDVRLTARWTRIHAAGRKNKAMWRQKVLAGVLMVVIVFLAVAVAIANRLVAVYHLTDVYYDENNVEQSERYTIKREDGVYKLFNRDGKLMETTENGYTSSSDGIRYEVYVAETSGNQYLINTSTGEYETYAIVDYDANIGESLGGTVVNKRVMMFPRIGQDNTYSIKVTNEHGSYEFYRENVEDPDEPGKYTTQVHIRGTEASLATYDPTLFASLCVSTGYTLTMQKLDLTDPEAPRKPDGSINYASYGLEDVYDAEGNLTYTPAVYTIVKADFAANGSCSASDTSYTVKVGDAILSGAGYYVMLEGRDAVYIVSSDIANTVLQPVESLVTPAIIYPMTISTYVMVHDFRLGTVGSIDWSAEPEEDEEEGSGDNESSETNGNDADGGKDDIVEDIETDVELIAAFDFIDLEQRENSIYSSVPYWLTEDISLMNGYQLNNDSVSTVLTTMYEMEFVGCRVLAPQAGDVSKGEINDFIEYNLSENVFLLTFKYDPMAADGGSPEDEWVENILIISQKTEQGTYYVYSLLYNMIVEVDQHFFPFLDWPQNRWYHQYFFQNNISYLQTISFTMGGQTYSFTTDNRLSYAFYDNGDGTGKIIDLSRGTIRQREDGAWIYTETRTGTEHTVYFMDFAAGRTYRDEETGKIMYRAENGLLVEVSESSNNMQVSYEHGGSSGLLDYVINNTFVNDKGETETETLTASENFRRLYSHLLWYSIEGDVNEKELGMTIEEYVKTHEATAEIRFSVEDMASILNPEHYEQNNHRDMVIRLYQYTERKMMLTIEVLDGPDDTPDPTQAQGGFYVLADEMYNLMQYAEDLLNQVMLPSTI